MTVCELIKYLEKCPCDARVVLKDEYSDEFGIRVIIVKQVITGEDDTTVYICM